MTKHEEKTQERAAAFEKLRKEMDGKGYRETVRTISVLKANVVGTLAVLPILAACLIAYHLKWSGFNLPSAPSVSILPTLALAFTSIIVHEWLHGIVWALVCEHKWKSVHFGVIWSKLTPYCSCAEPLNIANYVTALLMPLAVLGIGIFAVALAVGNPLLFYLSLFNISAASGDILIGLMLVRHKDSVIIDHPTEVGFVVFQR